MERIPTKLIVEKGQVFTTDKPMPKAPDAFEIISSSDALPSWDWALESWKKEAFMVENKLTFFVDLALFISKGGVVSSELASCKDGVYSSPDGLVFEAKEIDDGYDDVLNQEGSAVIGREQRFKQVAILSFKEPSKEIKKHYKCRLDEQECLETCHGNKELKEKCEFCKVTVKHCSTHCDWPNCTLDGCVTKTKEPSSKRPDFPEWIKSKDGVDCMRWPISEPKYLENRLAWAFDAGRNCVWDQFMKQKEILQSLEQKLEGLREKSKYPRVMEASDDGDNWYAHTICYESLFDSSMMPREKKFLDIHGHFWKHARAVKE